MITLYMSWYIQAGGCARKTKWKHGSRRRVVIDIVEDVVVNLRMAVEESAPE